MESLHMPWVDTHCHLYSDEFLADREAMIARALDGGVTRMMLPNIDLHSIPGMMDLVSRYPEHCFPMMGLHPCSVKEDFESVLDQMESLLETGEYVGIGETGIDLYWDTTFRDQQILAFERQIGWARKYRLPVIIHSRESQDLTIDVISRFQDGQLRGIFHCFGGTVEQVERIQSLGFKVGIGGVATFKKSGLTELLPLIPLDMIVLETDAPYLAPVPYRGKRNEPSYIPLIANHICNVLGISQEELSRITFENAASVYGKKD